MLAKLRTPMQLIRGFGCTVNDMWDKDLDAQVERTRYRPLASGVVSMRAAAVFAACQAAGGLSLLLQLNAYTIVLGCAAVPLVAAYPLMKRVTNLVRQRTSIMMTSG
jgi:4-hydroxybenzoate polyprenyltransferase